MRRIWQSFKQFKQSFNQSYADSLHRWHAWGYDKSFAWGAMVARGRFYVNSIVGFKLIPRWLAMFVAVAPSLIIAAGIFALQFYIICKLGAGLYFYWFPVSDAVAQLPSK